ncbi:MAG: aminopeptidase P family N-terminal domain-containing protein, partial [Acidobacteriota bacterium]
MISRRTMLTSGALAAGSIGSSFSLGSAEAQPAALPPSISALTSMRSQATPISRDERKVRVEKARRLMSEHKIDALMLTGGTSLLYFSGIRWGVSERLFALVIPKTGEPLVVCPAFEEERAREQFATSPFNGTADVRVWEEHESPYERLAQGLKDRGVTTGRVGVEE